MISSCISLSRLMVSAAGSTPFWMMPREVRMILRSVERSLTILMYSLMSRFSGMSSTSEVTKAWPPTNCSFFFFSSRLETVMMSAAESALISCRTAWAIRHVAVAKKILAADLGKDLVDVAVVDQHGPQQRFFGDLVVGQGLVDFKRHGPAQAWVSSSSFRTSDLDLGVHVLEQLDLGREIAQPLDGFLEMDLLLLHAEALGREFLLDLGRGHRAEQDVVLARPSS